MATYDTGPETKPDEGIKFNKPDFKKLEEGLSEWEETRALFNEFTEAVGKVRDETLRRRFDI